jgi:uncharacterized protein YqgC (DUF456 family)
MSEILLTILLGFAMLVGLAGMILPVLPDMLLIWASALLYGLLIGWGQYGSWLFAAISVLALVGLLADAWVSGLGARQGGASFWSSLGGLASGIVGLFVAGPLGLIGGMLLGIFIIEYWIHQDPDRALRATFGMGVGYGASFIVKIFLGLLIIAIWIFWVFSG